MNSSWIEILIDPASVTSARGADQRRSAIALLLDGRLDEYERRSADAHLPSLAEAGVTTPPDAEAQLVVAVARLAEGQPNAIDLFTSLAASTDVPTDLRSVAAVLAGMAMSDAARPDLALPLLDGRLSEATDDVEIAFLEMHWAARAAECGRFGEAHARSVSAQATAQRAEESAETIRIVAAHNAAQFAWLAGEPRFPADLPRRADSKPIAWMDILAAGALEDYLDGHFKAFFERPYARSVTFAREDQTERGLSRALFRAQCLADWHGEARLRKALGRYRLLSEAGRTIPGAASGFELLVELETRRGWSGPLACFERLGRLSRFGTAGHVLPQCRGGRLSCARTSRSWRRPLMRSTPRALAARSTEFSTA